MPAEDHTLLELAPLSDEEVVARVLAGDAAVFELLMRRHNQRLFRVARSVVGDDGEAEDVVQETYVRAYTHLARFEGRSSVATWLTRIALHESLRRRRRGRRARALGSVVVGPDEPVAAEADGPVARTETRTMLTEALDALPVTLRAVVVLRLVQGLSTRETAACLRMSEANVKVSLHRGRRMLLEAVQRRVLPELRGQYEFGAERCDRVVEEVFRRVGVRERHSAAGE
jgi:RNA polymerase sigma-70 factor, ECF subfamily